MTFEAGFDDFLTARRARRLGPRSRRVGISIRRPDRLLARVREKGRWDPRREVQTFDDLKTVWIVRGRVAARGPVQRWIPKGLAGKPVFVFETGGTTGIPKTRVACEDFRIDYEIFSETLPDEHFPKGSNWLCLAPRVRAGSGCRSSTSRSIAAAASASASISIRAGSSS